MPHAIIETAISCPHCDRPVPLNGPWEAAHCDHCQSDIEIPQEFWVDTLRDVREDIDEIEPGMGQNSSIFGMFRSTRMIGNLVPYCIKCKTDFDPATMSAGMKHKVCPECGERHVITPSPDWLRTALPPVEYFMDAILIDTSGEGSQTATTGKPVVFVCPQCGGALKVDGSDRMVPCKFCNVDVYLPDDLWLRLHPAKKKERWFIVFNDEPLPAED
jgi:Zn finger protein HypA/HybF involved in hydrogenase expression